MLPKTCRPAEPSRPKWYRARITGVVRMLGHAAALCRARFLRDPTVVAQALPPSTSQPATDVARAALPDCHGNEPRRWSTPRLSRWSDRSGHLARWMPRCRVLPDASVRWPFGPHAGASSGASGNGFRGRPTGRNEAAATTAVSRSTRLSVRGAASTPEADRARRGGRRAQTSHGVPPRGNVRSRLIPRRGSTQPS
jgi:hypothetical protein